MILDKAELIRRLDALELEMDNVIPTTRKMAEITRGVDDVDTDDWSVIDWLADEQLPGLRERIAVLRRDVLTDL